MTATANSHERIGKYVLLEKMAAGGMAEVWLASSTQVGGLTKFVAIKKILPHLSKDKEFIQMFKDEASVVMNLSHSNIVSITGYYQSDVTNELYLVMDFVEGRNLRQILEKMKLAKKRFSLSQIVYVIKEISAGLDHAHRSLNSATGRPLNVIHRDVSPQNCMVSFEGEVKIVDFGIAKAESQLEKTEVGTLKGKFGYMSPEQADGRTLDLRTDIFSLGIVLWELLAGERLFSGKNEMSILEKIRKCQIPNLGELNSDVPVEVQKIALKALARDPDMRYQTAAAMHRDLNRFLNTYDPDFTTPDFAVSIRTLFADEVLEARQKLIRYSQLVANLDVKATASLVAETHKEDRTEIWTFNQDSSDGEPGDVTRIGVAKVKSEAVAVAVASPIAKEAANNDDFVKVDYFNGEDNFSIVGRSIEKSSDPRPADMVSNSFSVKPTKPADETAKIESPAPDIKPLPVISKPKAPYIAPSYVPPRSSTERSGAIKSIFGLVVLIATGAIVYMALSNANQPKFETTNTVGVRPIKVPAFLKESEEKSEKNVALPTTPVVFKSVPSGADIWIDSGEGFKKIGRTTPLEINVPTDRTFKVRFKKFRYADFDASNLSAKELGGKFEANLAHQPTGFVDIVANKAAADAKIFVNNIEVEDGSLPLTRYEIPANTEVSIRIESASLSSKTEKTLKLEEGERRTIEFAL